MNPLIRHFGVELLDDMVEVGIAKWLMLFLVALLMTRAIWASGGLLRLAGVIFSLNLGFALLATLYWTHKKRRGPVYDG